MTDRAVHPAALPQQAGGPRGVASFDLSSYDQCFAPHGPVTLANLPEIRRQGEEALAAAGARASIDLSGLTNGNSAAVAALIGWLRRAQALGKALVFTGTSTDLQKIIELSGIARLLPTASGRTASGGFPPGAHEERK